MAKIKNKVKADKADALINELGGVCATAKICEIATSSVVSWRKLGVPRARLMFLQVKFPNLKIWQSIS